MAGTAVTAQPHLSLQWGPPDRRWERRGSDKGLKDPSEGRLSKRLLQWEPPEVAFQALKNLTIPRKAVKKPCPQVQMLARAQNQLPELGLGTYNGSH